MTAESILSTVPTNTNFLSPNKWIFQVPSLPDVNFFCQSVSLPSITTSEVMVPTPFSDTYRHGDKLVFDPLVVTFLVDEDLRNWEACMNWLFGLTFPEQFSQYQNQKRKGLYYDCILQLNKNSNEENIRFKFFHCHPVNLGAINFSFANDPSNTPTCDLTLRYDRFVLERLS